MDQVLDRATRGSLFGGNRSKRSRRLPGRQASASERHIHRQVARSARPTLERVAKRPRRRATGTPHGRSPRSSFTRSRRLVLVAAIYGDQVRRDQEPESKAAEHRAERGRVDAKAEQRPSGPKRQYTAIASNCRAKRMLVSVVLLGRYRERWYAGCWWSQSCWLLDASWIQRYWRGSNCCPGTSCWPQVVWSYEVTSLSCSVATRPSPLDWDQPSKNQRRLVPLVPGLHAHHQKQDPIDCPGRHRRRAIFLVLAPVAQHVRQRVPRLPSGHRS
jgi:hypothetical protein